MSAPNSAPVFEHHGATRAVYALDLPGFGASDRSDRVYLPRLMTDAMHAMVTRMRAVHQARYDAFLKQ